MRPAPSRETMLAFPVPTRATIVNEPAKLRQATRPLRLLLIQPQAENAGAQEVARLLSRGLKQDGHTVGHLFFFRRTASFDVEEDVRFCAASRPTGPLGVLKLLARLHAEIRRFKPDVVLCFQHYGNVIGGPMARLAGVKLVVANQNSAALTTPKPARIADRILGSIGVFKSIVAVSAAAAAGYDDYPAAYRARLSRIDHGVDVKVGELGKAAARARFGLPETGVVLGCASRLHPLKNLQAAVRLLALEPSWTLALAGQGTEREALLKLAGDLGCAERLRLLGELDAAGVADFLTALDVFVFPSLAETFGMAVVEAAQAGVPVVAHGLPVLKEVLQADGEPCALFVDDIDDIAALRTAVARFLDDAQMAQAFAARGRSLAERYPVSAMVDEYERLLRSITRGL
ncbi:glycosyltransferase family 4 protein [Alsobacter sp. KACC 23698]|uniref:Glycosyltransferase family 4 protein n=1 Tax=Alsobacter sp. KACC 23698 TaxID=3149229 RepID=A0AAU7JJ50_9HYPH